MSYDFIDQNIVASCLIQAHTDDSFYEPIANSHTGFAFDGNYYLQGSVATGHPQASWFTEFGVNLTTRGSTAAFPDFGIVLLSPASLVILDQSKAVLQASVLPLWMQFVLADDSMFGNNFNGSVQGFLPSAVCYADGIVSVTYTSDAGNQLTYTNSQHPVLKPYPAPYPIVSAQSHMVVSIDFTRDNAYLDVAV